MSRREEYEQKAEELITPIVEANGFELVDVEYVNALDTHGEDGLGESFLPEVEGFRQEMGAASTTVPS